MRNKKNYHKRKLRRGRILLFLAAVLLIFCLLLKVPALFSESIGEDTFRTFSLYRTKEIASDDIHKGELILVNASWPYSFPNEDETVPIASQKNDSWRVKDDVIRLLPVTIRQMNRMFSACERKTGIDNISVISAYRDYAYQDGLFNDRVNSDGYYEAIRWVAVPGYSEHHTGYAADLAVADDEGNTSTFTGEDDYGWVEENAWKYGFIRRYPSDKTSLTGIANEPWHYRYVGKPHAYIMHTTGMCLEEYEEYVKSYRFGEKYIDLNIHGDEYKIYYIPASDAETTEIRVPLFGSYTVSGNNTDGFIVTEKD